MAHRASLKGHHIAGKVRAGAATFETLDPSNEEPIARIARGGPGDVDAAVSAAQAAFRGPWRETTPAERGALLLKLADAVAAAREDLAVLETREVGKPLSGSRGDIDGVIETLRYNAGAADKMQGEVIPLGNAFVDFADLEPVGVTAHIVPWNYPLGMAVRSLAPALAAGCTAVVKPAEQSSLSTLRFAEIAVAAGLPAGVVNVVCGFGPEAGAPLVDDPRVRAVHFTGSVEVGRQVAVAAARGMKSAVLELGGKNAMIVRADADLGRAVEDALVGGFDNAGQVCSASSRLIVHQDVAVEFSEALAEKVKALRVGPGLEDPDVGPVVSSEQRSKILEYIAGARASGVQALVGGGSARGFARGYFIAPTILGDVDAALPIAREEVFGPVVTITTVSSDEEALRIANDVPTGLVAGIHTRDVGRALAMARRLETGSVWINGWYLGGVQAPTGGMKDSGLGRERGLAGVRNFLRIKNVAVRLPGLNLPF
jgi:acyl-CoA reductase-like NAD-dependent aldehyde dehydrogenase